MISLGKDELPQVILQNNISGLDRGRSRAKAIEAEIIMHRCTDNEMADQEHHTDVYHIRIMKSLSWSSFDLKDLPTCDPGCNYYFVIVCWKRRSSSNTKSREKPLSADETTTTNCKHSSLLHAHKLQGKITGPCGKQQRLSNEGKILRTHGKKARCFEKEAPKNLPNPARVGTLSLAYMRDQSR